MTHTVRLLLRSRLAALLPGLLLLAGCASAPHMMGDPLAGTGVNASSRQSASLHALAHQDIVLVRSKNTGSVIDAVSVWNGMDIMFNQGALPKSADYDFAGQIASATAELFKDRFGKVVDAASLDDAASKGPRTAAVLDLQVYDSKPGADDRDYFFRSHLALYFVDVKTRRILGEVSAGHTLKLAAEPARDKETAVDRKNRLLNQILARTFLSLANELDPRLGTTQKPLVLPVMEPNPNPGPNPFPEPVKPAKKYKSAKRNRHAMILAKKLRELDELRAYGFISDPEYDVRRHDLMHKYRRYLN